MFQLWFEWPSAEGLSKGQNKENLTYSRVTYQHFVITSTFSLDTFQPKDMAAINERRKEFNQNSNQTMQSNQRYHADEVEERFAKYKPGVMRQELKNDLFLRFILYCHRITKSFQGCDSTVLFNSEDLLSALGIDGNTLPPLIYRMRQLGYPPGWLKEAEMENSGLILYDGNGV